MNLILILITWNQVKDTGNIIFHREWQRIGKNYKQFATDYSVIKAFDEEVLINDSGNINYRKRILKAKRWKWSEHMQLFRAQAGR